MIDISRESGYIEGIAVVENEFDERVGRRRICPINIERRRRCPFREPAL